MPSAPFLHCRSCSLASAPSWRDWATAARWPLPSTGAASAACRQCPPPSPACVLRAPSRSAPASNRHPAAARRRYLLQEGAKEALAGGRWRCRLEGKAFLSEAFIDAHMAHRHPHLELAQVHTGGLN